MKRYRIGEIAKLTGVTVRTLRYYEEEGLISSHRSSARQRYYSEEVIIYIRRVIELKALGFTLEEIRKIMRGAVSECFGIPVQRTLPSAKRIDTQGCRIS